MKKIFFLCLVILALVSCQTTPKETATHEHEHKTITVSTGPVYSLVKQIVQDKLEIINVSAKGDVHHFEPTFDDIKTIQDSALFVYLSENLEPWVDTVKNNLSKDTKVLKLEEGLSNKQEDTHTWLSPTFAVTFAEKITEEVKMFDKENADFYQKQLDTFKNDMTTLMAEAKEKLAPFKGSNVLVGHAAFGYLFADLGLNQVALDSSTSDASLKSMRTIVDDIEAGKYSFIVSEAFGHDHDHNHDHDHDHDHEEHEHNHDHDDHDHKHQHHDGPLALEDLPENLRDKTPTKITLHGDHWHLIYEDGTNIGVHNDPSKLFPNIVIEAHEHHDDHDHDRDHDHDHEEHDHDHEHEHEEHNHDHADHDDHHHHHHGVIDKNVLAVIEKANLKHIQLYTMEFVPENMTYFEMLSENIHQLIEAFNVQH